MIKMEKSAAEKEGLHKEYALLSWGNEGTGKEHVPLSKTLCDETSDMGECTVTKAGALVVSATQLC